VLTAETASRNEGGLLLFRLFIGYKYIQIIIPIVEYNFYGGFKCLIQKKKTYKLKNYRSG
jgi:hypothetical protein